MLSAIVPPVVTGTVLRTTGAEQVVVTCCPGCAQAHRHVSLGLRTPPCGHVYVVQLDDDRHRAA